MGRTQTHSEEATPVSSAARRDTKLEVIVRPVSHVDRDAAPRIARGEES